VFALVLPRVWSLVSWEQEGGPALTAHCSASTCTSLFTLNTYMHSCYAEGGLTGTCHSSGWHHSSLPLQGGTPYRRGMFFSFFHILCCCWVSVVQPRQIHKHTPGRGRRRPASPGDRRTVCDHPTCKHWPRGEGGRQRTTHTNKKKKRRGNKRENTKSSVNPRKMRTA
jgi:hypothetical protein